MPGGLEFDFEQWCEKCCKTTTHKTEHVRIEGEGNHYKLRDYCLKCGRVKRELQFR